MSPCCIDVETWRAFVAGIHFADTAECAWALHATQYVKQGPERGRSYNTNRIPPLLLTCHSLSRIDTQNETSHTQETILSSLCPTIDPYDAPIDNGSFVSLLSRYISPLVGRPHRHSPGDSFLSNTALLRRPPRVVLDMCIRGDRLGFPVQRPGGGSRGGRPS